MKKITLFFLLAFSLNGFSQTRSIVFLDQQIENFVSQNQSSVNSQLEKFKKDRTVESQWVCYIDQVNINNGGSINDDALMHIFPDSTIILGVTTTGDIVHTWNHAGGTMIDPTFMPDAWLNYNSNYVLDSIAFLYAYTRHTDNTVVDTIHIELIKSIDNQLYTMTSGGQEEYQDILFDSINHKTVSSNVITSWDIPLTEADSSLEDAGGLVGIKTIAIATPYSNFTQGARIGAMFSFKPGYSWNISDSLAGKNAFSLLTSEENGDNTDAVWLGDHNCSYILTDDVYYSTDTLGWNGYYLPTWTWTTPFDWEHHYVFFKLTADNVGINETSNLGGSLSVYPNPVIENATLKYITNHNSNVNFYVYDVTGAKVMGLRNGIQNSGSHEMNMNLSALSNGLYTIEMETSIGKSIQKIVVVH